MLDHQPRWQRSNYYITMMVMENRGVSAYEAFVRLFVLMCLNI